MPLFRPQGDRILYTRGQHGGYRDETIAYGLSTIAADGFSYHRVTRNGEFDAQWSPDGRYIVGVRTPWISRDTSQKPGIWVMRANGHHATRILRGEVRDADWQPRWLADDAS